MIFNYIYDIETYPNFFSLGIEYEATGEYWQFEMSDRRNDISAILSFLWMLARSPNVRMVGFNNEGFDYPIIHYIMQMGETITIDMIYQKAQSIIDGERFESIVWESDRFIDQVDLFKIHHFDNKAKSTSLKVLEFNMRSDNIEDLPYPPKTHIPPDGYDIVLNYNKHDVSETTKFFRHSDEAVAFRDELSSKHGRNYTNFNDTKIGKEFFITELEKANPGCCYDKSTGRRQPRQTFRHAINLGEVILPYIQFDSNELTQFKNWLSQQVITETKGIFKGLSVTLNGFTFDFGLGGLHGSIDNSIIESNDDYVIIDLDVTSYYPSLAIENNLYPEHLGQTFCVIYADLKKQRTTYKKGTAENAVLKLALNGTFGDSNNVYSPFYDPKFTMAITINGQLLLCRLSEMLMTVPGLRMIQANTDGVTIYCPRSQVEAVKQIRGQWEQLTSLELEEAIYTRMFIRDVNNYLAEDDKGKIKRKGAYAYETPLENPNTGELGWHKNHGGRIIAKAAESALLDDEDIESYIKTHPQPLDFMLRAKIPRNSKLMINENGTVRQLQNTTRYYVSNYGGSMYKLMPPVKGKEWLTVNIYWMPDGGEVTARTKTEIKKVEKKGQFMGQRVIAAPQRKTDINSGYFVTPANRLDGATKFDFNYDWYINEARKLVEPLKRLVV